MFSQLKNTILKLNSDISNAANQEKAVALRKKLLKWGGILLGIGIAGIIGCFIAFFISSFSSMQSMTFGFSTGTIVAFCLFIPFMFVIAIGSILLKLGFSILIAGAATKFMDKSLNKRCENCGNMIEDGEKFCPKCGHAAVRVCPKCQTENDRDDEYCSNCGYKL